MCNLTVSTYHKEKYS